MLGKRFPRLDEDDRLSIYHDAWARIYSKRERGEEIRSLRAYLLSTAGAEALNMLTRRRPAPVGPDDPRIAGLADDRPGVEEEVVCRDQARIARDLLDTLDGRQRDVLKLRWDLQLSAEEIRAALGLSERQYQRLVERGAAAVAERVRELESGAWSRRQRSLLTACLVQVARGDDVRDGIASDGQREEAQRLLDSDPHVAAIYAEVRSALGRVAAIAPLPALLGPGDASAADRLLAPVAGIRGQVADLVTATKHHATAAYLRVADPTLLGSSPRPGAATAAVAGVLAVTGGAYGTYEAVRDPHPRQAQIPAPDSSRPSQPEPTAALSPRPSRPHTPVDREPQAPPVAPEPKDSHDSQETFEPAPIPTPPPPPPTPKPPTSNGEFTFEQ